MVIRSVNFFLNIMSSEGIGPMDTKRATSFNKRKKKKRRVTSNPKATSEEMTA